MFGRLLAFVLFGKLRASAVALRATTKQVGAVVSAGGPPGLRRIGETMVRLGLQPV